MKEVAIDIETVERPDLDDITKGLLKKLAEKDKMESIGALLPMAGMVVSIGMMNCETFRGGVFYIHPDGGEKTTYSIPGYEDKISCALVPQPDEASVLKMFWKHLKECDRVISWFGRKFDAPFIMMRSAEEKVEIERNLCPPRFDHKTHLDLDDVATFQGATRHLSLDLTARLMEIPSPKDQGVSGADVAKLWSERRFLEIAQYNARDTMTTAMLRNRLQRLSVFLTG